MITPPAPETEPQEVAPETFLIPSLMPAGPDAYVPVNSMLIRGAEPVIVDTSAPIFHDRWIEMVFSLVDPEDVRWIFLSHDDGDHTGGLLDTLEMCPNATLITNFFSVERLALEKPALPPERMTWIDPGGSIDVGDRTLHLFRPPIFDGPTTRGLFDPTTATAWVVDTFACQVQGAVYDARDVDPEMLATTLPLFNSMVSPWHAWLDPAVYRAHVDTVEGLGILQALSAHAPVLSGEALHAAFDVLRDLAGAPIIPPPGQEVLDELLAPALAAPTAG